jgi:hypothetical protein
MMTVTPPSQDFQHSKDGMDIRMLSKEGQGFYMENYNHRGRKLKTEINEKTACVCGWEA